MRDMFGGSHKTSLDDAAGVQNGYSSTFCRAPVIHQTKDVCLQELERINQEIENVKHEVEREERRLCCYNSVEVASKLSSCRFDTAGKGAAGGPNGRPLSADPTKADATSHKYVIDNSKPRTDLEYDPMSNFSADFGSYRQSKDQKVKNGQGLKRARNSDQSDGVKSATYQAQLSRMPSPEPLDDSYDDSILIIDIPPSPKRKRASAQEPVECVPVSAQDELKEWRNPSSKLPVDAETFKVTSPPKSLLNKESHRAAEKRQDKSCEMMADSRNMMDLERYLEDLNSERQSGNLKRPHPASPPHTLLLQRKREEASPQSSYKTSVGSSCQPCKLGKQTPKTEQFTDAHQLSLRQSDWKTSSERPAETQVKSVSSDNFLQRDEPESDSSWHQISHIAFVSSQTTKAAGTKAEQPAVRAGNEDVILIDSSGDDNGEEDEECPYSDVELSDSDPMEECYRIFMEANEKGNQMQPDVSVGALEVSKPEVEVKPQGIPGKRMAHEVKHSELPVPKGRPEPRVLVPLRGPAVPGFAPQLSMAPKLQQAQQMASVLSASVRGGQAFVSSTAQRKLDIQTAAPAPAPVPAPAPAPQAVAQTTPAQNAYMNCIPLGATVIDVGNNLHLILPQGTFPLPTTSTSSPVTSVLTPINQVHVSPVGGKHTQAPGILTPVPKYRTAAPLLISAPARKPSPTLTFANMATTAPSHSVAVAKPAAGKRKAKQVGEAAKEKVPHDVRQRYVNMFTEEFLKTTADINEAFGKALAEEKTVYNRSMNKLKYLSIAVNALKRLKSQNSATAVKDEKGISQRSKGKITLNRKMLKRNDDTALYESLRDYILPEGTLIENNYPVQNPEKPCCAVVFAESKKANTDPLKRICCRCGATYSVSSTGKHTRKEECNYHYGKGVEKRVPGGVETRYICCEGVMGAPGCQVFKLHVHDSISLEGFVATSPRQPTDGSCPGIYAVDCEMCYTINGLELSRVTVVNSGLQVVYDSFIRPDNEVIDYNTRFSGISEADVKGNCTSLKEVQEILLSFINADTILIGHGLETSLCALKLFHGTVVDTSIVFPHRLGPPHKLTLNTLTAEYLRRIIQESVCGHDTADDAAACMELMLWKVKDGKLKK